MRWLLDHVFLDREAVPRLVEVRQSSDTRIQREVVGQTSTTLPTLSCTGR